MDNFTGYKYGPWAGLPGSVANGHEASDTKNIHPRE